MLERTRITSFYGDKHTDSVQYIDEDISKTEFSSLPRDVERRRRVAVDDSVLFSPFGAFLHLSACYSNSDLGTLPCILSPAAFL
jgi:hypothetical protein